jgi:lipid-A-disaccharide synthase-like uncharacterized protein
LLETLFFIIGLLNNILLILIFLIRKKRLNLLHRFGWTYLLLAIPAIYAIFLAYQEQKAVQYSIFLGIFLAFLALEGLYDFILKVPFREEKKWKLLVPYLVLYYAMNYGFVVMVWKISLIGGFIMLGLFVIQIFVNLRTHP